MNTSSFRTAALSLIAVVAIFSLDALSYSSALVRTTSSSISGFILHVPSPVSYSPVCLGGQCFNALDSYSDLDLSSKIADWYSLDVAPVLLIVKTSNKVGKAMGLDSNLLLAMIAVESGFDPESESKMGAQGLMQVIPKWHPLKVGLIQGTGKSLYDPESNILVGAAVLKDYWRKTGTLSEALKRYNGTTSDRYYRKVMTELARIEHMDLEG